MSAKKREPGQVLDGLVQRGEVWYYVVRVTNPATGRRKPRWYRGGSYKDAKRLRDDARDRENKGLLAPPSKQTLGEYLVDWLGSVDGQVRPNTFLSYSIHVHRHIIPAIGGCKLTVLRPQVLTKFYGELQKTGKTSQRKVKEGEEPPAPQGLSRASVKRIHTTLRTALAAAVPNPLPVNPAEKAMPPVEGTDHSTEMTTWTADELRSFLEFAEDDRQYPLWLMMAMTGCRRGEALGLAWDDVDLDSKRVSIQRARVSVGYEVRVMPPKTKKSERSIPLDEYTVDALTAWRDCQELERKLAGDAWIDTGLVFTREDGEGLHPDRVSKLFEKLVAESKLRRIRLHDLRHTYATLALAAGIHVKVVAARLGHARESMTLEVYSHAIPALEESAAALVPNLVLGGSR